MEKKFWQNRIKVENQYVLYLLIFIAAVIVAAVTKLNSIGTLVVCILIGIDFVFFVHGVIAGKYNKVLFDRTGFIIIKACRIIADCRWSDVADCAIEKKTASPRSFSYYKLLMKDGREFLIEQNDRPEGCVENYIKVEGLNEKPKEKTRLDIINYLSRTGRAVISILFIAISFIIGTCVHMYRRGLIIDFAHLLKFTGISSAVGIFLFLLFALQMSRLKLEVSAYGLSVVLPRKRWDIQWGDVYEVCEYKRQWGKSEYPFYCFKITDKEGLPYNEIHIDKTLKLTHEIETYYKGKIVSKQ